MKNYNNVKQLIATHSGQLTKSSNPELYAQIEKLTNFFVKSTKIKERIHAILHDIATVPHCKHCGVNPVKFLGPASGYRKYCSLICRANDPEWQEKRANGCLKSHGVSFPAQSIVVKSKTLDTIHKKYGTNVECTLHSDRGKAATKNNNIAKYGYQFSTRKHLSESTVNLLNDKCYLHQQHILNKRSVHDISVELGVSDYTIVRALIDHNIEYHRRPSKSSIQEDQLYQYINSLLPNVEIIRSASNIITPYHLDIYIPSKHLAIEYNGLYWHNDLIRKNKNYHLNKTDKCKQMGIKLFHVFENNWIHNNDWIKSELCNFVGRSNAIYATNIQPMSAKVVRNFQQTIPTLNSKALGLYANDLLVGVIEFRTSGDVVKILKMQFSYNTTVINGLYLIHNYVSKHTTCSTIEHLCDVSTNSYEMFLQNQYKIVKTYPPKPHYFEPGCTKLSNTKSKYTIWDCGTILVSLPV